MPSPAVELHSGMLAGAMNRTFPLRPHARLTLAAWLCACVVVARADDDVEQEPVVDAAGNRLA